MANVMNSAGKAAIESSTSAAVRAGTIDHACGRLSVAEAARALQAAFDRIERVTLLVGAAHELLEGVSTDSDRPCATLECALEDLVKVSDVLFAALELAGHPTAVGWLASKTAVGAAQ